MGWAMLIAGIIGIITGGSLLHGRYFLDGFIFLSLAIFLLVGLRSVKEQERWVIELFGKYLMTLKPGIRWIFPGAMKVRAKLGIWEQTIPLFVKPIKIDFKDGSATPQGANAFVRVNSPDDPYSVRGDKPRTGVFRAIYNIKNWRIAIEELAENASRSYLNSLTINVGLTEKGAGFDLTNKFPGEEQERIKNALSDWGWELTRITITDLDLEKELVEARGRVQIQEKQAEAAKYEREKIARETVGALVQMMAEATGIEFKDMQKKVGQDSELQKEIMIFAQELITRQMSIKGKSLSDIRVSGGGGSIEQGLLTIIAALKEGREDRTKKEKEEDKEEGGAE